MSQASSAPDEPQDDDPVAINLDRLEGRKSFAGAASSKRDFDQFFSSAKDSIQALSVTPRAVKPRKEGIVSHTRRVFKLVKDNRPDWCNDFTRLVVAAMAMYRLRLTDITTTEMVQLVWLTLGEVRLRSHGGELYFFSKDTLAFSMFRGMLPEVVFKEVREFMNKLEGLFRAFSGKVERKDVALLEALDKVLDKEEMTSKIMQAWLPESLPSS